MRALVLGAAIAGAGLVVGGCGRGTFACQTDDQCGSEGLCEATGYCSFADGECSSGRRYGALGPADLAGRCVGQEIATSGTSGSSGGPATPRPGTEESAGESSGEPTACAGEAQCFPDAPGFIGPLHLSVAPFADGEPAPCPSSASSLLDEAFGDLSWADVPCPCACEPELDCGSVPIYNPQEEEGCSPSNQIDLGLVKGECYSVPPGVLDPTSSIFIDWDAGLAMMGLACFDTAQQEPPEFPQPQWSFSASLCSAEEASSCDGGRCLDGSEGEICVYASGDVDCPSSSYPNKSLLHRSFEDSRRCDPCECDTIIDGPLCSFNVYDDPECEGRPLTYSSDEGLSCAPVIDFSDEFYFDFSSSATCGSAIPEPSGEILALDPVTVCCG